MTVNVETLLRGIQQNPGNEQAQQRLARDLAHSMHHDQPEHLRQLLSGLAVVNAEDLRAQGYLEALSDLVAAFEAELHPIAAQRAAARKVKPRWKKVLSSFFDGVTPSELAGATELAIETVSRTLRELRDEGMIESYEREGEDARRRPHRLTRAGRKLAADLGSPPLPPSLTAIIRAATAFHSRLNRELEVVPRRLLEPVGRALEGSGLDPAVVLDALGTAALADGTAWRAGAALRAESGDAMECLLNRLEQALEEETTPEFMQALAREAPPNSVELIVRPSNRTRDSWRLFLRSAANPYVENCQMIETGDVLLDAVEAPPGTFAVLYDASSLRDDDAARPVTSGLQRRANWVHVIGEAPGAARDVGP